MSETLSWRTLLADIQRAQTRNGRIDTGCFSLEGVRLVERALRAQAPLRGVLVSATFAAAEAPRQQRLLADLAAVCPVVVAPDTAVATVTHGRGLGDVLALAALPPPLTLPDMITPGHEPPLLLVAADIVDPGNVGALVRTGHASGITAFVALGRSDPFHPKAVRTSMGSLFKTAVVVYEQPEALLAACRESGIRTVGTVATDGLPVMAADWRVGTAVFMGNEYNGLQPDIIPHLDQFITIPMAAGVDSYSVNAAAAIILYEARRQRLLPA